MKSTSSSQCAPAAISNAEDDASTSGHVFDESRVKFAEFVEFVETLGFSPVSGTGKTSGALPMFRNVAVRGL
jgi:hypothetical protein